jgi:hypothetical protein
MKAELFSCPIEQHPGYAWKWRAADGSESKKSFAYYYEALTDAREHGHNVELKGATGTRNPGGARHNLA